MGIKEEFEKAFEEACCKPGTKEPRNLVALWAAQWMAEKLASIGESGNPLVLVQTKAEITFITTEQIRQIAKELSQ